LSSSSGMPLKITQPLLPDLNGMNLMVKEIWDSGQLSNNGNMVKQLEAKLCEHLSVDSLSVFANGTIALSIACRLLNLSGEVITTPFTFPATVNVLAWNQITPVFCDIEKNTYNMDPAKIEPLITEKTTAILPVHVFGNPSDVDRIERLADRYGLKVLYDAAHAFGVRYNGKALSSYGDLSMLSFHATKVYHTLEGGALVFNRPSMKERADALRNFGLPGNEEDIVEPGTNGKLNEVQAAVGLLLLEKIDREIEKRKQIFSEYTRLLADVPGIRINTPLEGIVYNYPYFVIEIDRSKFGLSRDELHQKLHAAFIYSRRYFYPLCSNLRCYRDLPSSDPAKLPVANQVADSVLTLPLYGAMTDEDVAYVCDKIHASRNES